jgi:hypothetical protein
MSRCGMMDLTFIAKPLRQLNRLVELDISFNKYVSPLFCLISARALAPSHRTR